jgi:hypothetical protein
MIIGVAASVRCGVQRKLSATTESSRCIQPAKNRVGLSVAHAVRAVVIIVNDVPQRFIPMQKLKEYNEFRPFKITFEVSTFV